MNYKTSSLTSRNKKSLFKNDLSNLLKVIANKKEFFLLIFINLIVQIYITYYVFTNYDSTKQFEQNRMLIYLVWLILFVLIIILAIVPMPSWLKFFIFSLFSGATGYLLSGIKNKVGEDVLKSAVVGTFSIFIVMFIFGIFLIATGIQFSYQFAFGLLLALLLLIFLRIVDIFFITSSFFKKAIIVFSLILFSIFIIYDTNSILQRDYRGDFITASLDYYLDIINLFQTLIADNA
jgi:FtsH-binding integral membrane protein